jgi:hypothetical protein
MPRYPTPLATRDWIPRNPTLDAPHPTRVSLGTQVVWLFVMALPIACIAWTVTQEEVFREVRQYAERQSEQAPQLWKRKFFYLLTCHYCFSHYLTVVFLALTRYKLLYQDWRGYIIGGFALVWVANVYIAGYALLRQDLKKEKFVARQIERQVEEESTPTIGRPAA